jgi:putative ABC transport system permease protein
MADVDWRREIRDAFARRGRAAPDTDILDELAGHAEASYAAARAERLEPAEARARVGEDIDAWSRDLPDVRRRPRRAAPLDPPPAAAARMSGLARDVRYAARVALRRPGATAACVLTVAVGIAATTSLFSLAYGVLLRPLPWPDADRLVRVTETREHATRQTSLLTNIAYHAWNDNPATIESLAAWSNRSYTLDQGGAVERVRGAAVSASLFPTLRASVSHGRVFGEADEDVVLISERLAGRRFGGPTEALGERLRLGDAEMTIIGVLPRAFAFPARDVDLWEPFEVPPASTDGSLSFFSAVARLAPGATIAQATDEATARGRAAPDPGLVVMAIFGGGGALQISVVPWLDSVTASVRPGLLILVAGMTLLLAAGVGNLISLQLARTSGRGRELAIRASMGAGRWRLARQLLAETLLVAVLGGAAGLLAAIWLHSALPALLPADFARLDDVAIDAPVAAFAAALALLVGLLVGVLPAWQAGRLDVASTLAEDSLAPIGHGRRSRVGRTRAFIIAGQVAASVVLLIGAGLLGRTLLNLASIDPGLRADRLLTGRVISTIPATPGRGLPGLGEIVARLEALPGVESVAVASALPLPSTGESMMAFRVGPDDRYATVVDVQATQRSVTPDYFDVLGMRTIAGRALSADDARRTDTTATVVNETFARAWLGDRPLGPFGPRIEGRAAFDIVGVVADVRLPSGEPAEPEMFVPLDDVDRSTGRPALFVRTAGEPADVVPSVRAVLREVDATMGLDSAVLMDDLLAEQLAGPRLYAVIVGVFAAFAVLIAGIGLFGVVSYAVAQRRRELGVRAALGATPAGIVRLVIAQGLWPLVSGAVAGLAASALVARSLSSLLYGVVPYDPFTFAVVPLVLLTMALVACGVPARRAAGLDPLKAMRQG